jgi:hypothetical protein
MNMRNIFLTIAAAAGFAAAQYAAWSDSANILINTTSSFGNVTGTVTDIPIPVRLNAGNFTFSEANTDGSDIRFSRGGAALPYEIELWDAAGGQAVFWVKLDTVTGNSVTNFNIHWGNAAATSESSPSAVFGSAGGYSSVYHLSETPGDSGSILDHSGNGFNGTPVGTMDAADLVSGVVGKGLDFDGTDDYVDLGTLTSDFSGGVTMCGWMYYHTFANYSRMMDCGNGPQDNTVLIANIGTTSDVRWEVWNQDGGRSPLDVPNIYADNDWTYVCGTTDAQGNMGLYKNGESVATMQNAVLPAVGDRTLCYLGKSIWNDAPYDGVQDEIHLSTVGRSADFIKLSYETQKPATIVGGPIAATYTDESLSAANVTVSEGDTISLTGVADCAVYARWVVTGASDSVIANGITASLPAGRIVGDTTHQLRFEAYFMGSGWKTADLTLTITEAIPDPAFTLTSSANPWNGLDTLYIIATIDNLTEITNSPFPDITSNWSTSGVIVSRSPLGDTLIVRNARESGTLVAKFCAENGGLNVCDSVDITIELQDPITVLTPNGGEELTGGDVYDVTWESIGTITAVHVQYQLDGGTWATAAINQDNTGTYEWTVPNTPSTSVLLRVVSATGGLLDMSDAPFTILPGTSIRAYRSNQGIVFQIKGLKLQWQRGRQWHIPGADDWCEHNQGVQSSGGVGKEEQVRRQ